MAAGCTLRASSSYQPSGGQAVPAFGNDLERGDGASRHAALIESERLYDDINASEGRSNLDIEKHLRRSEVKRPKLRPGSPWPGSSATKANGTATQEPERGSQLALLGICSRQRVPPASKPEAVIRSVLPFATSRPDVGVAELAGLAPARQVLAGQLLPGRLDQRLGVVAQVAAEQGDGLVRPYVATG